MGIYTKDPETGILKKISGGDIRPGTYLTPENIKDNLTTTAGGNALDARQGVVLSSRIEELNTTVSDLGDNVQGKLDFLEGEISGVSQNLTTLEAKALKDVMLFTLESDAWVANIDTMIMEQAIENDIFAADNYSYYIAVSPLDAFAAADIGGVIMASVGDGSAIFQCRRQPDANITIQIERTVGRDYA